MNCVRIALFKDRAAAEPLRDRLLQSHIPAELHDEPWLARLWFVSKLSAGVRVEVPVRFSEAAMQLLLTWEADEGTFPGAIRCPECNSSRVDYPQFTQKSFFTNVAIGLIAELGLIQKEYYCEDCHGTWPKPGLGRRRARAHLAPNYFIEGLVPSELPASVQMRRLEISERLFFDEPRPEICSTAPSPTCLTLGRWRRKVRVISVPLAAMMLLATNSNSLAPSLKPSSPIGVGVNSAVRTGKQGSESPTYLRDVLPILMGKCARCHSDPTGIMHNWMNYKAAFDDRWEMKRRVWNSWKGLYFKQPMPTANSPEDQIMTEEERLTIRDWVESGAPRGVPPTYSDVQSKAERIEYGRRLFTTICATCHQPTGHGIPARFTPLAGSDFLNADKHRAIKIVANGLQGEVVVNGQKFNNSMPKFPLSDHDIASVLTYVYNSFGNSGKEVTPREVSMARLENDGTTLSQQGNSAVPQEKSPWE